MAVDEHWDVLLESVRECAKPAKHRSISIHVGMIFVWYLTCFIVLPPIYGRSLRMVVYGCLDVYGIWVYRFTTLVGYHVFFLRFMSIMRSTEKMTTTVWFIEHNWLMYTCNGYETVLFLSLCLSLSWKVRLWPYRHRLTLPLGSPRGLPWLTRSIKIQPIAFGVIDF